MFSYFGVTLMVMYSECCIDLMMEKTDNIFMILKVVIYDDLIWNNRMKHARNYSEKMKYLCLLCMFLCHLQKTWTLEKMTNDSKLKQYNYEVNPRITIKFINIDANWNYWLRSLHIMPWHTVGCLPSYSHQIEQYETRACSEWSVSFPLNILPWKF